jgi:hypothetical protein
MDSIHTQHEVRSKASYMEGEIGCMSASTQSQSPDSAVDQLLRI